MKFDWAENKTRHAIQEISQTAMVLRPRPALHILRDELDNRILECAMAAPADWIVSGDRHLLALKRHQGSTIISLADFLADLQESTSSHRTLAFPIRTFLQYSRYFDSKIGLDVSDCTPSLNPFRSTESKEIHL